MKRKTLILTSAIALGTIIPTLTACNNGPTTPVIDVAINKSITGTGANFVTVEYDETNLEPGESFSFTIKISDAKAKVTSVKFNGAGLAINPSNVYTNTLKKGENTIEIETTYEDDSVKIVKNIEGPGADHVQIFFAGTDYEPGDELVFRLQYDTGVEIEEVFFNNKPLNVSSKNEYSVTLRKGENVIRIVTSYDAPLNPEFEGEAALVLGNDNRDVFPLTKTGNVFESAEIEIKDTTRFAIFHKEGDKKVPYSSTKVLDATKTFASITNNPTGSNGTFSEMSLVITGGAKYKFYLDLDSKTPLYVVRTEITALPDSPKDLNALLNNVNYGESYNLRQDIKHIDFYAKTYQLNNGLPYEETSTFDRYNNSSLTTASIKQDKISKESLVYREVKDGVFYEVDTLPNFYGDDAHVEDFAGKYKIVDKFSDFSTYERTQAQADSLIANPIRNVGSVGAFLYTTYQGYSNKNDGIKITSTETAQGFDATIYGRKIVEENAGAFKYALISQGKISFRKDGALLGTDVTVKQYGSDSFDTVNNQIKPGMEDKGTLYTKVTSTFTYGLEELTDHPTNDYLTKYFVQSIDDVIIKDNTLTAEGNNIYPDYAIQFGTQTKELTMDLAVSPKTALDKPQYGIIATTDENVIGLAPGSSSVYVSKHINTVSKIGETTLTIGNRADNKVTTTTQVKVHDIIKIKELFINDPYNSSINGNYSDENMLNTFNSTLLQFGHKYSIKIGVSPSNASVSDVTLKAPEGTLTEKYQGTSPLVTRTFNEYGELVLNIDLTQGFDFDTVNKITTPLTLDVTFISANFNISNANSQMHFRVMPQVQKSDIYGTWESVFSDQGMSWHSTLIINEKGITVECPEAWKELKINVPVIFTNGFIQGQDNVPWDFFAGSYEINTKTFDVPVKNGIANLYFDQLYYNPFTKTIDVNLTYTEWTGGDATELPIIGFGDGVVEQLTRTK